MKFKKIILGSLAILGAISLATGCSSEKVEEKQKEEPKGNCTVFECIKKIEVTNTKEEIDEIIGFEGETSEYSGEVTWKLDSKNWITLKPGTDSQIVQATIDKETIKNDNVTLPASKELQELINKGITYEELVEKIGAEGVINSKTKTSVGYIWADKNGQRLGATINNKSKKCTVASYR